MFTYNKYNDTETCSCTFLDIFAHFQVHYTFNKILMLQEPLLVVGAFYILFFTVIIYVRLDFAITKVCSTTTTSCLPLFL